MAAAAPVTTPAKPAAAARLPSLTGSPAGTPARVSWHAAAGWQGPQPAPGAQASWAAEARKRRCRLPARTRAATPIRRARTPRTRTPRSYDTARRWYCFRRCAAGDVRTAFRWAKPWRRPAFSLDWAVSPGDLAAALPLRVDPVSLLLSLVAVTADGGNIHTNKLTGRSQLRQHQADAANDGVLRAAARAERQQLDRKSGGERAQNQHARVQIHIAQD